MDLQQLKHCLQAAGVPEEVYLLIGLDPPRAVREGACIIRPNQRSWEVFVWRPVRVEPSLSFLTEDEACEYVLEVLTSAVTASASATSSPRSQVARSQVARSRVDRSQADRPPASAPVGELRS